MIIQPYEFKGIQLRSAIQITKVEATPGTSDGLFNVKIQINRYTDSSCQYDIEQFTKEFNDVPDSTVDGISIVNLSVFEDLLLTDSDFTGATKV